MQTPQQSSSFEERLSQWIGGQGLWFQLRHSTGKSVAARLGGRLLHLSLRLLLVTAAGGLLAGVYLAKRVEMKGYMKGLDAAAAKVLGAESAKVSGFQRVRGQAYVHVLTATGGKNSFFYELEARGVRYRMGLMDGLAGTWEAGPVMVNSARMMIKAGAGDAAEAAGSVDCLFRREGRFAFDMIEVLNADLEWGYSERTRGRVAGTHLIGQRVGDEWRFEMRGGRFSQNWLQGFEIDEMLVRCGPKSLVFEKAELRMGDGKASLRATVSGGLEPSLEGRLAFTRLDLRRLLPAEFHAFVEGSVSGELRLGGSTNSQRGIETEGEILLGLDDRLVLRDRLPLLRALTVVDSFNTYRKVEFTTGGMRLRTGGGEAHFDGIELDAKELMKLRGRLQARPPTTEEVARLLADGPRAAETSFLAAVAEQGDDGAGTDEDEEFSLKRAAKETRKTEGVGPDGSGADPGGPLLGGLGLGMKDDLRQRYARMPVYEGSFVMMLPGDAFEQSRGLREANPVDPSSGRIPLEVPISGSLYELTLGQAEEIYQKGKRYE